MRKEVRPTVLTWLITFFGSQCHLLQAVTTPPFPPPPPQKMGGAKAFVCLYFFLLFHMDRLHWLSNVPRKGILSLSLSLSLSLLSRDATLLHIPCFFSWLFFPSPSLSLSFFLPLVWRFNNILHSLLLGYPAQNPPFPSFPPPLPPSPSTPVFAAMKVAQKREEGEEKMTMPYYTG